MLPWASFPKRIPTDERFAPRSVAHEARCGQVPSHASAEARARSSVLPEVPLGLSRHVVLQSPLSRRSCVALRCDVPQRAASRMLRSPTHGVHQVPETDQRALGQPSRDEATGSAFPPDVDHLAKCGRVQPGLPRRSASGPEYRPFARCWGFRDLVCDTTPRIARPLGQARESAFISVQDASGPASSSSTLPSGARLSPREHT
jgi:hypothetical protein